MWDPEHHIFLFPRRHDIVTTFFRCHDVVAEWWQWNVLLRSGTSSLRKHKWWWKGLLAPPGQKHSNIPEPSPSFHWTSWVMTWRPCWYLPDFGIPTVTKPRLGRGLWDIPSVCRQVRRWSNIQMGHVTSYFVWLQTRYRLYRRIVLTFTSAWNKKATFYKKDKLLAAGLSNQKSAHHWE